MIKAIIVDDELSAIESLRWELGKFCQGIEVIESFTDPLEAISAINYLKPDCIFLDIEMPEMDGFQLLHNLQFKDFDLIITTAFDSYALKAFQENAIDYLLKPIDTDDLVKSVNKVKKNKENSVLGHQLQQAIQSLIPKRESHKIPFHLSGKTVFVKSSEIVYCKSDGNYSKIVLLDGQTLMVSKKIKDVEQQIDHADFYRVHNSYLVNIAFIKEFIKTDGQYLLLETGDTIPVSRSRKMALLEALNA